MKKILTIILDGFGMKEDIYGNAVKNAGMNNFIKIWNKYPHCLLKSSENSVGLPKNQAGSSEIGHKIIGSGKKIKSKLEIVNEAMNKNLFYNNENFNKMIQYLHKSNKNLHIISLLSDGGITSHINHLIYMIKILKKQNINHVYLHLIADGQDSSIFGALNFLKLVEEECNNNFKISTLCGRYYALDKSQNYKKTKNYYDLLINGQGINSPSISRIVDLCYSKKISDQYLPPIKTKDYVPIDYEDVILFMNYSRINQYQFLNSLTNKQFEKFKTIDLNLKIYSLFEINSKIKTEYFFEENKCENTLCEYIGKLGLSQARIMENFKNESMTYFLDGSREIKIDNCDNFVVPSTKIDNIEKKPELNALSIAKTIIKCMDNDYDFIIANFANPDEIGHTGNYQATINGLQAIDVCLGKILEVASDNFYKVIIIGDHAKADTIIDRENNIVTQNTLSPVPFIITDKKVSLINGDLTMVAPTILKYMDIALPKQMKKNQDLFDKE